MQPLKTFENLPKDKQQRITAVALREFGEKGYAGTSINTLVNRLGIAKGSIFQYFGDKQGLFMFVFQAAVEMAKDHLRTVRSQTEAAHFFTRLEATLQAGQQFLGRHPILYRLYLKVMFEENIPFRNELLSSLRTTSIEYLRDLLRTARRRGEIRSDLDEDSLCFVLDAVMDRFLQSQTVPHLDGGLGLYGCSSDTAAQWIANLRRLLAEGMAPR
jgi:TetR/AcrR family transcriptional regulator